MELMDRKNRIHIWIDGYFWETSFLSKMTFFSCLKDEFVLFFYWKNPVENLEKIYFFLFLSTFFIVSFAIFFSSSRNMGRERGTDRVLWSKIESRACLDQTGVYALNWSSSSFPFFHLFFQSPFSFLMKKERSSDRWSNEFLRRVSFLYQKGVHRNSSTKCNSFRVFPTLITSWLAEVSRNWNVLFPSSLIPFLWQVHLSYVSCFLSRFAIYFCRFTFTRFRQAGIGNKDTGSLGSWALPCSCPHW